MYSPWVYRLPVLPKHIALVVEVGVDQVVTCEVLVYVLLTVLPVGVGVSLDPRPDCTYFIKIFTNNFVFITPDLLLYHKVHVAASEGVASAEDAGDHHHQGAQAAVHDDLGEDYYETG